MKKFASVKREEYLLFQECSVGCVADAKLDKNDRMKKKSGLINHGLTYVNHNRAQRRLRSRRTVTKYPRAAKGTNEKEQGK